MEPGKNDIEVGEDDMDDVPSKWYDEFPYVKLPRVEDNGTDIEALRNEAEMIFEEETNNYKLFLSKCKKSETQWMMTVAKSGTSSDKVAALALLVQESPVHNLAALSSLVSLAKVSKKHQFIVVLETVTELFVSDLLRPSKKLRKFNKQPVSHLAELCKNDNKLRRKILCYWLFEDKLKTLYQQFLTLLNTAAHDSVQNNREKAIGAMLKLLLENREQEDFLITNLVNKLGDTVHKTASKVVYGLERVTHKYPKMKETILDEIEKMLFRSHIAKRAQYYGICFLSQYKLSGSDYDLCKRLIALYFSFFKACVKTGDIDSKLMGALLVGVNRAYPYAAKGSKNSESVIPVEHIETMYKIVHLAPFKISLQALSLLLQVTNNDRFYNALYKKLLDKELPFSSHQAIWINLMSRAMHKDTNVNRKKSFIKRILQVCLYFPVPLLCSTLILLSQSTKTIPDIDENFVFPSEVQVKKEESYPPDLMSNLKKFDDGDDEDTKPENDANTVRSSWFHRDLAPTKGFIVSEEKKHPEPVAFDPFHRNPAFAGGEKSAFVELIALSKHFHPTVALFAKKILLGQRINYTGDPLKDFTTLHFLDRFSFRNPKRSRWDKGEDKEELFRAVGSQRKHYTPTGVKAISVQSDQYLNKAESAIPVDELFLYRYLKSKKVSCKPKSKKQDDDSDVSDVESVGSVEFNDYLDELMVGKKGVAALDFENEIKTKRKKVDDDEIESDTDNDAEDEDLSDIGGDLSDIDGDLSDIDGSQSSIEEGQSSVEEDESDIEDFDDEQSDAEFSEDDKNEPLKTALRKRINRDFGNVAVPLDKFSEMLEETGKSKSGGSHDVLVKDNANRKQLKWEASKVKQRWRSKKPNMNQKWRNTKGKRRNFIKRT